MPTLTRSSLLVLTCASANRRSKSAAVTGRGLVWWQMSATAISTSRGICSALHADRATGSAAMPIVRFSSLQPRHERRAAAAHADGVRELVELRRHRLGVPGEHGVDHQRVGQAVVQVADGAERVRARVDRAEVLLERDRAHHRAHHHVGARLQVARLAHRGRRARAPRSACPRARCRRRAGDRPATGSSRRCASARPCRSPRSPPAAGRASAPGSAKTALARISGEKTTRLTCVSSSLMTLLRPTSLPVPEVVGSATKYGSVGVDRAHLRDGPRRTPSRRRRASPSRRRPWRRRARRRRRCRRRSRRGAPGTPPRRPSPALAVGLPNTPPNTATASPARREVGLQLGDQRQRREALVGDDERPLQALLAQVRADELARARRRSGSSSETRSG